MVHRKGSKIIGFEQLNFIRRKQYCNKRKLTQISHLKIFPEASAGHRKCCGGLHVVRRPLIAQCPPVV